MHRSLVSYVLAALILAVALVVSGLGSSVLFSEPTEPATDPTDPAVPEDPGDDPTTGDGDSAWGDDAMEQWAALAEPGPEHERLLAFVGDWNVSQKMYWDPTQPPETSEGTSHVESIMGGRFTRSDERFTMTLPGPDGETIEMPFNGELTLGYDNYRKVYIGTWMESLGTSIYTMKGSWPPDSSTFVLYGEMDEPMLGVVAAGSATSTSGSTRTTTCSACTTSMPPTTTW